MKWAWALAIAVTAILVGRCDCRDDRAVIRFATFNIQDFPKSNRQVEGAFAEIAATGATFVGLQEITDPQRFAREMRTRLGPSWELAFMSEGRPEADHPIHHLAVAYDRRTWMLVGTTTHDDTRLVERRWKPTFEARLRPRIGGEAISVLVVHLKAGGDGREIRARQYTALAAILHRIQQRTDRIVLLGDFNATDDVGDREDLARLADETDLLWATETLGCSAFWSRDDGCPRSRLDHVLVWRAARRVVAAGACASEGCGWADRCPLYAEEVSDHCPVVVDL